MNNKKKIILPIIIGLLMIIGVIGVTYAFFNYTRTGTANTVRTGRIYFNHTQDGKIELTNVFPTNKNNLDNTNSDTVTINIEGDTTYTDGIEYKVTLEEVNNTINNKEVPISIKATATNLGTEDSNYYTNRTNKTKIYLLNEEGEAYNGKYIVVGYIPEGSTGVDGSIDITAFIDKNKVAISDTYDGTESDLMGTTNDWVMGREVFTTTEWNSFQSIPLSFKVRVEAQEGTWIEPEKFLTIKNLNSDSNWTAIRASITSIEFHKDGVAPINPITSFDVTDTTSDPSKGNITLYTVDDGLGTNTYKAIVVANDTIYAPTASNMLFGMTSNLVTFNSKNFKVDNVTNMNNMFAMTGLTNVDSLINWNTSSVTTMNGLFFQSSLTNVNGLINWNVSNVKFMTQVFLGNSNLVNVDGLINWNISNATAISSFFYKCSSLSSISSLLNWNVSNSISMSRMFADCTSLENVSSINTWNINASADFTNMFQNTPTHPEFTKFPNGTWDDNGTFSPNA